ncbi:hypothetical protein MTR67_008230 [Solanum verrucosum]|uniref:Uncharacterized protein n=1 Tax=Solanum verrucosum TaxID=315347 RepID=A0AAF0TJ20_SOLVR|nr:hypothetical protein MTR67_008230 [Solanum verrucosum]
MVVVSEWERDKRRGEEENGVLLVVWVSLEAATVVADGRAAKEEQTKALAMPLMERRTQVLKTSDVIGAKLDLNLGLAGVR